MKELDFPPLNISCKLKYNLIQRYRNNYNADYYRKNGYFCTYNREEGTAKRRVDLLP